MKIAAISVSRKESIFCPMWVRHHARLFGAENLFINIHGEDGFPTQIPCGVNYIVHERPPEISRREVIRWASRTQSALASRLVSMGYDWVVRLDIDEFLVLDPDYEGDLAGLLSRFQGRRVVHATGVDVIHNPSCEPSVSGQEGKILQTHRHGILSRAFSKPCVVSGRVAWANGCHRVKRSSGHFISSDLYLFHLALADQRIVEARMKEVYQGKEELFAERLLQRKALLDASSTVEVMEFQHACIKGRSKMAPDDEVFAREDRTRTIDDATLYKGYYTKIPERFSDSIDFLFPE